MRSFLKIFVLVCAAGGLLSCQNLPTKVSSESNVTETLFGSAEEKFNKFLTKKPVILDARSPLDFTVSHPPGSISVQWDDFSGPGFKGWLQSDEFALARRLSLWGIDPETPVLVVGYGEKGKGEEGRVAWMLKYLGLTDVNIGAWTLVRSTIPRDEGSKENKPMWKPKVKSDFLATAEDFDEHITKGQVPFSSGARRQALQLPNAISVIGPEYVALDVREPLPGLKELEVKSPVKKIYWKNFITKEGLPSDDVRRQLEENHITKNKTIYVISENGVSSGLVTYILRDWGFMAKNFAGGFEYLEKVSK